VAFIFACVGNSVKPVAVGRTMGPTYLNMIHNRILANQRMPNPVLLRLSQLLCWLRGALLAYFLLTVAVVQAGTIAVSSAFTPAQLGRTAMDIGAVWDGSSVISPANGDRVTFTLSNSGTTSFDIKPSITIPAGFDVVMAGAHAPSVTSSGCAPTVPVLVSSQLLAGGILSYNLGSTGATDTGYDMVAGCAMTLQFKLVASLTAPVGTTFLRLNWTQNATDGGSPVVPAPAEALQAVQVEAGATTLDKLPTNQIRSVGSTAQWLTSAGQGVIVTNTGIGGLFDVKIDESLINPGGNLELTSLTSPTGLCAAGVCTLPYLAPGASFRADVEATVMGCVSIGNTVTTTDLTGATAKERFAQVTLDLPAPNVSITISPITLNYSGVAPVVVTVANAASAGTATGLSLQSNLHTMGLTISNVGTEWSYNAAMGVFTYNATGGNLAGNTSLNLTFDVAAANVCGSLPSGLGVWTAKYTNACGNAFAVPTVTHSVSPPSAVPSISLSKVAADSRVLVNETSRYVISLDAPHNALISGNDLVVTDTLPADISDVSLVASAGSFNCPGPCTGGSSITWTVPKTSVPATLTIDFKAPTSVCSAGTVLSNTANISATSVQSCDLSVSATASQLLINNPGGIFVQEYNVTGRSGSFFETGTGDNNNNGVRDALEGEPVQVTASYRWGPGSLGIFVGSRFDENFANQPLAQLVSQNGIRVRWASPATEPLGAYVAVPDAAITCDTGSRATNNCQGGFDIDLGFLAGSTFFNDNNVADKRLEISYQMTFPNAAVPDTGTATLTTLATLFLAESTSGCSGTNYTKGDFVPLARARADVSVTVPETLDVCEPFTASATVSNRNEEFIRNMLLTVLNDGGPFRIPDTTAHSTGDFFSSSGTWAYNAGTNPTFTLPIGVAMASSGTVNFPAFLGATATTTPASLTARADYDDLETSSTAAPDYAGVNGATGSATPDLIRRAVLAATVSPQSIMVSGNKVQWLVYLTNTGNGVARNTSMIQNLPAGLTVNETDTTAANTAFGVAYSGAGAVATFNVGLLQPGQQVVLTLVANVDKSTCSITGGTPIVSEWGCGTPFVASQTLNSSLPNFIIPAGQLQITTDSSESICPLCGVARHVIRLRNTGQATVYDTVVTEISNPLVTGLTLSAVDFSTDGINYTAIVVPVTGAGVVGDPYRIEKSHVPAMAELVPLSQAGGGKFAEIFIRFSFNTGDVTNAVSHNVTTTATANTACGAGVSSGDSVFALGVQRPIINVSKVGINRTVAGGLPTSGDYTATVFAGSTDVVEWRVTVANTGIAAAQNLRLTDVFADITTGTLELCNLNGGCANNYASFTPVSNNTRVTLPDLAAGETRILYLRETIGPTCLVGSSNTASLNWGCTSDAVLSGPTNNTGVAQLVTQPSLSSSVVVTPQNNGRAFVTYTVTNTGGNASNPRITTTIPSWAVLDETYSAPGHATFTVAGPLAGSVTGLTKGGTSSTPEWTIDGVFRTGQTLTLTYYLLPTNNANGVPRQAFNDNVFAETYPELTLVEETGVLDPVRPTAAQTLTMRMETVLPCANVFTEALAPLIMLIPDLDIRVNPGGQPNRLITSTSNTAQHTFVYQIFNNGANNSVADNFTFRIPLAGTAWGLHSVTAANIVQSASLSSFSCADDAGDQLCTFIGSVPRIAFVSGQLDIRVVLTLQNQNLPMEKRVALRGEIRQHDGTFWGLHTNDRAAFRTIGAMLTKTFTSSTDTGTTDSNLSIGEEVIHNNSLYLFGAGSNPITNTRLRDTLPTSSDATNNWLGYVSHNVTSATPPISTAPPASVTNGQLNLTFDAINSGTATLTFDTQSRALNRPAIVSSQPVTTQVGASFEYLGATFRGDHFGGCTVSATQLCDNTNLQRTSPPLTIHKPVPTVVKLARNRTQNGVWSTAINANAGDEIQFRITINNPSDVPMRNLVITDELDNRFVPRDLATDGLDNDGNGSVDSGNEGSISGQIITISDATADNPLLASLPQNTSVTVEFAATSLLSIPGGSVISNTAQLTWSSLPGSSDTSYNNVQTGSVAPYIPGDPDTLTGEFVGTLSAAAQVNFTRLSGRVYIDGNHNSTHDSGETLGAAYSGPPLYAKLIRGDGSFYQQVNVSSEGLFSFGTLPKDANWRLLITPVDGNTALTPALPSGYLGTQNAAFIVEFQIGTDGTLMPPFNFGIFRGARLDGQVIRDNGANGGIAHDAVLNGAESPLPGVPVCVSTSASCTGSLDSALTDADGRFTLYVSAASLASGLNVVESNPTGYLSVSGASGTLPAGAGYALGADSISIPANTLASGSTYTGLVFGDVQANALSPNHTRQALPSTQLLLPHVYVAQTTGSVAFDVASATSSPTGVVFTEALYRDLNCNGVLDAGDDIITAPIAMRAPNANTAPGLDNPALATPSKVCVLLRQFVPAEAGQGATRTVVPRALFVYGAGIGDETLTVQDITTVSSGATGLELIKAVDQVQASRGATLTYTLTFVNHSAQPITNLSINDMTPPYTGFLSAVWSGIPVSLGTCIKTTPVALAGVACGSTTGENPLGQLTGPIRWNFSGTLNPGDTGTVTFSVRID
jgi:uncharacterized repeat protein (TIGR01451 family)